MVKVNGNLIKVTCPNGHHFQVNLDKHLDRNYRLCPQCKAKVQVKSSLRNWNPSINWARIKREREDTRKEEKERKKQTKTWKPPAYLLKGSSL